MDFIELDGTGLRYELSGEGDRTGRYMAVQTPDLIADCIGAFLKAADA